MLSAVTELDLGTAELGQLLPWQHLQVRTQIRGSGLSSVSSFNFLQEP